MTFRYNKTSDTPVLDDINLSIASGETIGIIGGTGSSKSSLVNLISRLYDVSAGTVYVGGKDVRSYDLDTLRNEVSVVLQNNVLSPVPSMTISAGETRMQPMNNAGMPATLPALQNLSTVFRMAITRTLNRVVPMSPVDRNSVCVSQERC